MNKDLGNHSMDHLYYLTHWLDISQNSERNKARIQQFERNYYDNFCWLCFIRGEREMWEKDILINDVEELENLASSEYISED